MNDEGDRSFATAWAVLVAATGFSWVLSLEQGHGSTTLVSCVILLVAFVKVRLVGLYFMELKKAPLVLRGLFEAYTGIVCAVLIGIYVSS
jgi:hypothetical protein